MSSILDDAREKIAKKLYKQRWYESQPSWKDSKLKSLFRNYARQILAISGTTDIECPDCEGDFKDCPRCDGSSVIKHKWKVSVTLENGELPEVDDTYKDFGGNDTIWEESQQSMLNAKYRQVVE